MRQLDRVGKNIKPNPRIRQVDRVNNIVEQELDNNLPINEEELYLLKKIQEKEKEARDLYCIGQEDAAIQILEENISHGIYCESYKILSRRYYHNQQYSKAIEVLKKTNKFF